jgi:uncharacterized RDD family membrane protein YckC
MAGPGPVPVHEASQPGGWGPEPRGYLRGYRLAPWWQRAIAFMVDWMGFTVLAVPGIILIIAHQSSVDCAPVAVECVNESVWARSRVVQDAGIGLVVLAWLVLGLNWAVWQGRTGRSLGKRLLGLRLVDVANFQPIGVGRGLKRYLLRWLFIVIGNVCLPIQTFSFLMPLWDRRRQTLEDKAAKSVVIARQPSHGAAPDEARRAGPR